MNLNSIANAVIVSVNANEDVYLIQSLGQQNIKGRIVSDFAPAQLVSAQIQPISTDDLKQFDNTLRTEITRKFYLASKTLAGHKPQGIVRVNQQGGDFIYRITDNTFFKIVSVIDDYSQEGWVSVAATMQVDIPEQVKSALMVPLND